jgi:hypothetical protein
MGEPQQGRRRPRLAQPEQLPENMEEDEDEDFVAGEESESSSLAEEETGSDHEVPYEPEGGSRLGGRSWGRAPASSAAPPSLPAAHHSRCAGSSWPSLAAVPDQPQRPSSRLACRRSLPVRAAALRRLTPHPRRPGGPSSPHHPPPPTLGRAELPDLPTDGDDAGAFSWDGSSLAPSGAGATPVRPPAPQLPQRQLSAAHSLGGGLSTSLLAALGPLSAPIGALRDPAGSSRCACRATPVESLGGARGALCPPQAALARPALLLLVFAHRAPARAPAHTSANHPRPAPLSPPASDLAAALAGEDEALSRRTRAHMDLSAITIDELEALLCEDEPGTSERDQAQYQSFLLVRVWGGRARGAGGGGGVATGQLPGVACLVRGWVMGSGQARCREYLVGRRCAPAAAQALLAARRRLPARPCYWASWPALQGLQRPGPAGGQAGGRAGVRRALHRSLELLPGWQCACRLSALLPLRPPTCRRCRAAAASPRRRRGRRTTLTSGWTPACTWRRVGRGGAAAAGGLGRRASWWLLRHRSACAA